jgi:hypothetical protein
MLTQLSLVVIYRRFGTTYRPHQGAIGFPEATVNANILVLQEDIMGAVHSYESYVSARPLDITSPKTVISRFLFVFLRGFF